MELLEINNNITYPLVESNNGLTVNSIVKINCSMTYDHFFSQHLLKNQPCVIEKGIVNKWPCAQQWSLDDAPNFQYLRQFYGNYQVPVANCNIKYYNAQLKDAMTLNQFLNYWEEFKSKNYPKEMLVLYLKDWHCLKANPNSIFYTVPKYFASDWLNEYYLAHPDLNDDYMFVYMGPKGSWTPLHVDVFKSYSWSANIVGKKRWLLFPPGEENNLCDARGHLVYDVDNLEYNKVLNNNKYLEIIQNPGEIVFVPSGWHHQVWNLEDTISINHNWINGCNILNVWMELKNALKSVMKEIEDCLSMENWLSHCQIILKASHGIDYQQFYDFLSFIIEKRLNAINKQKDCTIFDTWKFGRNHLLFDLDRAKEVLNNLIVDSKEKNIYDIVFCESRPENLLDRVESILKYQNIYSLPNYNEN
ncbi:2-oxoglutarate and iron-dependent oxygenase JMJD4 [Chelonus insularis]|uniref:2-oxoglutarate and iron-dependent oxygenase JMJD4 n=1 Tax=Chelonus insularis TaxID=460826 RepID=UPI00158AF5FB|nr:2-oxoglutarate and iron-dependent oxygenase JMJD4 [Chelonus insularis]